MPYLCGRLSAHARARTGRARGGEGRSRRALARDSIERGFKHTPSEETPAARVGVCQWVGRFPSRGCVYARLAKDGSERHERARAGPGRGVPPTRRRRRWRSSFSTPRATRNHCRPVPLSPPPIARTLKHTRARRLHSIAALPHPRPTTHPPISTSSAPHPNRRPCRQQQHRQRCRSRAAPRSGSCASTWRRRTRRCGSASCPRLPEEQEDGQEHQHQHQQHHQGLPAA